MTLKLMRLNDRSRERRHASDGLIDQQAINKKKVSMKKAGVSNGRKAKHLHERTYVDRKLIMCSMLGEGTKDEQVRQQEIAAPL